MKHILAAFMFISVGAVAMEKKEEGKFVPYDKLSDNEKLELHAQNVQVYGAAFQTLYLMNASRDKVLETMEKDAFDNVKKLFVRNLNEYNYLDGRRSIYK